MSQLVEYAETLAESIKDALTTAEVKAVATANIRQAGPPAVLVVPTPRREYDDLIGGFEATWSVYCISSGAFGDLTDAKVIEQLAAIVVPLIDGSNVTVEPVSIVLPTAQDAKAALLITFTNHVTPEEE